MGFLSIFSKKKHKKEEVNARDSAKERLKSLVGNGRRMVYRIDDFKNPEELAEKTAEIKSEIQKKASQLFKTDEAKVKVVVEEHNGYVVIIANINFE
jgi:septum formation topological specificity factor MinE